MNIQTDFTHPYQRVICLIRELVGCSTFDINFKMLFANYVSICIDTKQI